MSDDMSGELSNFRARSMARRSKASEPEERAPTRKQLLEYFQTERTWPEIQAWAQADLHIEYRQVKEKVDSLMIAGVLKRSGRGVVSASVPAQQAEQAPAVQREEPEREPTYEPSHEPEPAEISSDPQATPHEEVGARQQKVLDALASGCSSVREISKTIGANHDDTNYSLKKLIAKGRVELCFDEKQVKRFYLQGKAPSLPLKVRRGRPLGSNSKRPAVAKRAPALPVPSTEKSGVQWTNLDERVVVIVAPVEQLPAVLSALSALK